MSLVDRMIAATQRALPAEEAAAHCDIPCGIYDPHAGSDRRAHRHSDGPV